MGIRVTGIVLSIISLSLALIKPFEYVTNSLLVSGLLVLAALLIIIGELLVISMGVSDEIKNRKQREESIYDIATTGLVVVLYVIFYFVPFLNKNIW